MWYVTMYCNLINGCVYCSLCMHSGDVFSPTPWHQGGRVRREQQYMVVSLLSLLLPTGDSPAAPLLLPSPVLVLTLAHVGISSMLLQAIRSTLGLFLPVQVGTTLFVPSLLIAWLCFGWSMQKKVMLCSYVGTLLKKVGSFFRANFIVLVCGT